MVKVDVKVGGGVPSIEDRVTLLERRVDDLDDLEHRVDELELRQAMMLRRLVGDAETTAALEERNDPRG